MLNNQMVNNMIMTNIDQQCHTISYLRVIENGVYHVLPQMESLKQTDSRSDFGGILFSETPKSPLFVKFPSSKPTVSYGK